MLKYNGIFFMNVVVKVMSQTKKNRKKKHQRLKIQKQMCRARFLFSKKGTSPPTVKNKPQSHPQCGTSLDWGVFQTKKL